jgi:outer membrane lipoprotein-sorting protein
VRVTARQGVQASAVNILRRLPLSRLLLLCGLVVALGASGAAIASAVGSGPTPPPKPLATAVHDALNGSPVEGVSASVRLTNHLVEGADLATGGGGEASQLAASPLLSGASGRLWIAKDGRARLELQAEKGDTQVIYDGHTAELYDASTNTLYRYTLPAGSGGTDTGHASESSHEPPSVAKIEEAIAHLRKHADVSEATPTDVAGQAAYTVRISPNESGSLLGGVELSWDAVHGVPLRAAVYSSTSSAPVIELAASEVSYGPVPSSVFDFTPPPGVKVHDVTTSEAEGTDRAGKKSSGSSGERPHVTSRGHGVSSIAIVEGKARPGSSSPLPASLPNVKLGNGTSATELATPLGTVLSFERAGVRYLLAGSVTPSAIEAVAQGL